MTYSRGDEHANWMRAISPGAPETQVLSDNAKAGASWLAAIAAPVKPAAAPPIAHQPAVTPAAVVEIVLSNLIGNMNASAWAAAFVAANPEFNKDVAEQWLAKAIVCGFAHAYWAAELGEMARYQSFIDANLKAPIA